MAVLSVISVLIISTLSSRVSTCSLKITVLFTISLASSIISDSLDFKILNIKGWTVINSSSSYILIDILTVVASIKQLDFGTISISLFPTSSIPPSSMRCSTLREP